MNRQIINRVGITSALIGAVFLGTSLCAEAGGLKIVTGSHHFTRAPEDPPGIESLDFQAVQHADGTVTGEAHNALRDGNTVVWHSHLRIDCMHFLDDHTVILAGVDVWDSDPEYVGNTIAFIVRDNGEGRNAEPDQRTDVKYSNGVGFEVSCQVALDLIEAGLYDFEADLVSGETGNIQVKP